MIELLAAAYIIGQVQIGPNIIRTEYINELLYFMRLEIPNVSIGILKCPEQFFSLNVISLHNFH